MYSRGWHAQGNGPWLTEEVWAVGRVGLDMSLEATSISSGV